MSAGQDFDTLAFVEFVAFVESLKPPFTCFEIILASQLLRLILDKFAGNDARLSFDPFQQLFLHDCVCDFAACS